MEQHVASAKTRNERKGMKREASIEWRRVEQERMRLSGQERTAASEQKRWEWMRGQKQKRPGQMMQQKTGQVGCGEPKENEHEEREESEKWRELRWRRIGSKERSAEREMKKAPQTLHQP